MFVNHGCGPIYGTLHIQVTLQIAIVLHGKDKLPASLRWHDFGTKQHSIIPYEITYVWENCDVLPLVISSKMNYTCVLIFSCFFKTIQDAKI